MPFKSEPGPVEVYKDRKRSHVSCGGGGRDFCPRKGVNILSVVSGGLAPLKSCRGFRPLPHGVSLPLPLT